VTQARQKPDDPEVVLRLEGVSKVYSGTVAVKQADFEVRRGAVNVLVGENSAGKSTLMKIVARVERPTAGRIVLDGDPVIFSGTADAMGHGIGMVFQELNLFGNLSVAENVFANREITRAGRIDHPAQERETAAIMNRLGAPIDPRARVEDLMNVAPFIATLGTLYVARGAALLISDGSTFPNLEGNPAFGATRFAFLGAGKILYLPVAIWILIGLALIAAYVAQSTPLGRHIFMVGGNERAAALSGIRVNRVKFFVYMFSGFCAAIVGLIISSELMAAHPAAGETFELNAIAAAVLGGTSMSGGRGTVGARSSALS
jgi:ABC-type Fe3+/spermidine/putrescine transport system ATPase subunit